MSDSRRPGSQRMPDDSAFYDRVVPLLLLLMTVLLVLVLLVALAGVLGWIHF